MMNDESKKFSSVPHSSFNPIADAGLEPATYGLEIRCSNSIELIGCKLYVILGEAGDDDLFL